MQSVRGSEFADNFTGSNNQSGTEAFQGRGGDDIINGGGGFDRVLYWFRTDDNVTGGINVNMAAGTVVGDISVGSDTLLSIEGLRATNFDDTYDASGFTTTATLQLPNAGSADLLISLTATPPSRPRSTISRDLTATIASPATATRAFRTSTRTMA